MTLSLALQALRRHGHEALRYPCLPRSPFEGPAPAWMGDTWILCPAGSAPRRLSTDGLIKFAQSL